MARARSTAKKPAKKSGVFTLPTEEDLAAAAADRAAMTIANDYHPGRVQGLDYEKWASAFVDLSEEEHNPQRVARNRQRLRRKGYALLSGEPVVDGFESAEVWVKSRAQYNKDRLARIERIRELQRAGVMSDTALLKAEIRGPYGTSHA